MVGTRREVMAERARHSPDPASHRILGGTAVSQQILWSVLLTSGNEGWEKLYSPFLVYLCHPVAVNKAKFCQAHNFYLNKRVQKCLYSLFL